MSYKPRLVVELNLGDEELIHKLKIYAVTNRMTQKEAILLAIKKLLDGII